MKLNLQTNNQSFVIFDAAMIVLAIFGVMVGTVGLLLGGPWRLVTYLMLIGLLALVYGVWIAPRRLKITRVREPLVKAPKAWLKAVYIADLHAGPNKDRKWFDKVFGAIRDIEPDLLLAGGDFVVCDTAFLEKLEGLSKLDCGCGKFFVLGNHDYLDDPQEVRNQMISWGFIDLTNQAQTISFQDRALRLAGLDEAFFGTFRLPAREAEPKPMLVLAHEPDALLDMREGQADLVLCGHTHGGQIRLPFIGSLIVPSKLKRQADMGRKVINGIPTFITRGLGEVLCRARLFCPPEIVILELGI